MNSSINFSSFILFINSPKETITQPLWAFNEQSNGLSLWTILVVAKDRSQNSLFGKIKNKKFGCNINYQFQNRSSVKSEHEPFIHSFYKQSKGNPNSKHIIKQIFPIY